MTDLNFAPLDEILDALRKLEPRLLEGRVAIKGEITLHKALLQTLGAGTDPDGKPWLPRRVGGRAYANAASRLLTRASGKFIRCTLGPPEVYGHYGNSRLPERRMLPDAGAALPSIVIEALRAAALQAFDEAVK